MSEHASYFVFWSCVVVVGLGLASISVITLLDIRDLLRDILRRGTPFGGR